MKCSDEDCPSHKDGQGTFMGYAVFYGDRELAEDMRKVPAHYFTCTVCGSEACDEE